MAVKKSAKKFKGMRREEALRRVSGRGIRDRLWITSGPKGATGSTDLDSLNGGSFHKRRTLQSAGGTIRTFFGASARSIARSGPGHRLGFDGRVAP
jgi:hypothetical protein